MSQGKILHGETFDDHIPTHCELIFPNWSFTENVSETTEVKFNIVLEEISNDQLESYGNILEKCSID